MVYYSRTTRSMVPAAGMGRMGRSTKSKEAEARRVSIIEICVNRQRAAAASQQRKLDVDHCAAPVTR